MNFPAAVHALPERTPELVALLESWANVNSGSGNLEGRERMRPETAQRVLLGGHYDTVYEAGHPFQSCTRLDERTLRESKVAVIGGLLAGAPPTSTHLISNAALNSRACLGSVFEHADGIAIPEVCAHALGVKAGDQVSCSPLK